MTQPGRLLLWMILLTLPHAFAYAQVPSTAKDLIQQMKSAAGAVFTSDQTTDPAITLNTRWDGEVCRSTLSNNGKKPVRISEVVLLDLQHQLPAQTPIVGEGFTMLSLTTGTLGMPVDSSPYSDRKHYRLPEPESLRTVYGMLLLEPSVDEHLLLGFTGCNRFVGRISFNAARLRVSLDLENLSLAPGQTWELEPLLVTWSDSQSAVLSRLCNEIAKNHPPVFRKPVPTGWCSWYCFGPGVTERNIRDNLNWITGNFPSLRYVQIDDGYQPWMGDWLKPGKAFGGGVQLVLNEIRGQKLEPAIWVAPFIASPQSQLFHDHPDWFIQDDAGHPLSSDRVGFGGWRQGPWYALDGTHPEAQKFLEETFRTMRADWGCTYFKLDANYWGALQGGHFHDPTATRVEAYRRGMQAIRRGAGDGFLLGCNHPLWPSLGLIDGSRSSDDVSRSWGKFHETAQQNLLRAWQNGRLWWNDPDCLVLTNPSSGKSPATLTDDQFTFHATAILASGGLLLSGDDLPKLTAPRLAMLKKLCPPSGVAASFQGNRLEIGQINLADRTIICLFNWGDSPAQRTISFHDKGLSNRVTDFWTGNALGEHLAEFKTELPPRSARAVVVEQTEH